MRRAVLPDLIVAALATVPLGALAALLPAYRVGLLQASLLVLAALGLHAGLRALQAAFPKATPPPATRPPRPARRPSDLEHLERRVRLAAVSAMDAHLLRRHLRQIAAHHLASGHGVDLEAEPGAARSILGPELWALVGPDLDRPPQRDAPGLHAAALRAAIQRLEQT